MGWKMFIVKALKVTVYSSILETKTTKFAFEKDNRIFVNPLFGELDEDEEIVSIQWESTITAETEKELVENCIDLIMNNFRTGKDIEKTMKHWQYMNGFTNHIFPIE
jgi:hypothetical protein